MIRPRKFERPTKAQWGDGPWQSEPDLHQEVYRGLPIVVRRHPDWGNLNGYVGVYRDHPLFLRDLDDEGFDVHGGVTYSGPLMVDRRAWFIGFDTAHSGDLMPGMKATTKAAREANAQFLREAEAELEAIAARGEEPPAELLDRIRYLSGISGPLEAMDKVWPEWMQETYKPMPYVLAQCFRLADQILAQKREPRWRELMKARGIPRKSMEIRAQRRRARRLSARMKRFSAAMKERRADAANT